MTTGWSIPKADLGVAGTPINIGGKQFPRGVGTHAESKLRVDLGGRATRFFAQVGVDDGAGAQKSAAAGELLDEVGHFDERHHSGGWRLEAGGWGLGAGRRVASEGRVVSGFSRTDAVGSCR